MVNTADDESLALKQDFQTSISGLAEWELGESGEVYVVLSNSSSSSGALNLQAKLGERSDGERRSEGDVSMWREMRPKRRLDVRGPPAALTKTSARHDWAARPQGQSSPAGAKTPLSHPRHAWTLGSLELLWR
ncbi:hypothetical protein VTN02DRAFT_4617 [Thermoascus thermophilus]